MKRGCPCGCGRRPPIGEKRRWASPACFMKDSQPPKKGIGSVLRHDSLGQEVWLR